MGVDLQYTLALCWLGTVRAHFFQRGNSQGRGKEEGVAQQFRARWWSKALHGGNRVQLLLLAPAGNCSQLLALLTTALWLAYRLTVPCDAREGAG